MNEKETVKTEKETVVTDAETSAEKRREAVKTTKNNMWLATGASLIPVPWVDLAAVAGVELKMLADISKTYGVPYRANYGKAAIASFVGFVLPHAVSYGALGSMLKAIPGVGALSGPPAMAAFCAAYTYALGMVFIEHFESGGTFLSLHPEEVKEYFRTLFAEGRKVATTLGRDKKAEVPA